MSQILSLTLAYKYGKKNKSLAMDEVLRGGKRREGDRNEYLQQSSLPGAMDLQRNIHISEQFYEENVKKCT